MGAATAYADYSTGTPIFFMPRIRSSAHLAHADLALEKCRRIAASRACRAGLFSSEYSGMLTPRNDLKARQFTNLRDDRL